MEKDFGIAGQNENVDPAILQINDAENENDGSEVKIVDSFVSDDSSEGKQGLPIISLDNTKYQKKEKTKRTLAIAIPTSFLMIAVIFVISYFLLPIFANNGDEVIDCTSHTDLNGDGYCDECGKASEGVECEHVDGNLDSICDECGEIVNPSDNCHHEDFDDDDFCDVCGTDLSEMSLIKPVWNSQTIRIALNKSDNHAEFSSELERYVAGEGSYQKEVDRAVDRRNIKAVNETKVNPEYEYWDNLAGNDLGMSIDRIRDIVTSTVIKNAPDVYSTFIYDLVGASVQGLFANLKGTSRGEGNLRGLNYFDFVYDIDYEPEYSATGEDRGFMYEWMESVSLSRHKMYILASDYFMDMNRAMIMIPVNRELLESVVKDITGDRNNDGEYTIYDFYEQVKSGEWTYDLLIEYANVVHQDDGNTNTTDAWLGDNTVGFAMSSGDLAKSGIVHSTSINIIHKEWNLTTNDYGYYYPETNEPLYELSSAINRLLTAPGVIYVKNPYEYAGTPYENIISLGENNISAIRNRFSQGHVLFGDITMVGALEFNDYQYMGDGAFGVVPVPIYHDNIEEETGASIDRYNVQIHNVGRPGAIAYNTKKFVECTAFLNYQSTNSADVLNDYFNYELCNSGTDSTQGTIEMLEYLRANIGSSFDKAMEDAMGIFDTTSIDYKVTYMLSENDFNVPSIATVYQNNVGTKNGYLEDLIDYFKAAKD